MAALPHPARALPWALSCALLAPTLALAAPVHYTLEPTHTFPSFEADHFGGMSVWRGKFNSTQGKVVLDKAAKTGELSVTVDIHSIDYGLDAMNDKARSAELFDAATYPTATYQGKLVKWVKGAPTEAQGTLTLHGVSKPLTLKINSFKCVPHPMLKREF